MNAEEYIEENAMRFDIGYFVSKESALEAVRLERERVTNSALEAVRIERERMTNMFNQFLQKSHYTQMEFSFDPSEGTKLHITIE